VYITYIYIHLYVLSQWLVVLKKGVHMCCPLYVQCFHSYLISSEYIHCCERYCMLLHQMAVPWRLHLNWCCIFFGWSHDHEGDNHQCDTPLNPASANSNVTRPSQRQPQRKLPHKMLQLRNSANISTTSGLKDVHCCWSGMCTVRVDAPHRWHSGCS